MKRSRNSLRANDGALLGPKGQVNKLDSPTKGPTHFQMWKGQLKPDLKKKHKIPQNQSLNTQSRKLKFVCVITCHFFGKFALAFPMEFSKLNMGKRKG